MITEKMIDLDLFIPPQYHKLSDNKLSMVLMLNITEGMDQYADELFGHKTGCTFTVTLIGNAENCWLESLDMADITTLETMTAKLTNEEKIAVWHALSNQIERGFHTDVNTLIMEGWDSLTGKRLS